MRNFSLDASISQIRIRLINDITSIILLLSILALTALIYNSLQTGWNISLPVQISAALSILFLCVFHNRMNFTLRASILIGILFLMGLACFLAFGISSIGTPFFIFFVGIVTLLRGVRGGCIALVLLMAIIAGLYTAANNHWITYHFDYPTYSLTSFFWVSILIAMGIWAGNIFNTAEQLFCALSDALKAARRHAHEIFHQTDSLEKLLAERKRIEDEISRLSERLQQPSKMEAIGTLASGISHDFNNIISSVLALADLAKEKQQRGLNVDSELDKITNATHRAQDLVKHIKTFSRQTPIKRSPQKLAPLINEALDFIQATLPTAVTLKNDIQESNCYVMADPTQVHQILINLCTNALFAMKEKGGYLDIKLDEIEVNNLSNAKDSPPPLRYAHLIVSDTGCGISEDLIERIFTPFFTTKKNSEGTGMGLSVVHGIINDMGGSIKVVSKPGEGTSFEILFPICDMAPENETAGDENTKLERTPVLFAKV